LKAAEEGRTPGANAQQAAEEDDSIDAYTTLAGPIGVRFEVEPEGEFVEGEGSSDTVADGHQATEKDGERRMGAAQVQEPAIPDEEQNENTPDQVMNVVAADGDPFEWAHVGPDCHHEYANADKGDDKGNRGNKHALARPVGDGGMNQISQAGQLQQDQEHDDYQGGESEQK